MVMYVFYDGNHVWLSSFFYLQLSDQCIYDLMDGMDVDVLMDIWFLAILSYETPMLKNIIYTCRVHIHDMFDEMCVMDSRCPVKVLNNYFL